MRFLARAPLIAPLIVAVLGCGEKTFEYYRRLDVDPGSLIVTPSAPEGLSPSAPGWRYFRFRDARRRQSIAESQFDAGGRLLACRDDFNLDPEFRLMYRSKHQELWRGDFGLILASTTYYYSPDYAGQATTFETVPNANRTCAERPAELSAPPTETGRLDGISVVLIFATDSGSRVVTTNYDAEGRLYAFGTGQVDRRTGLPPDSLRASDVSIT